MPSSLIIGFALAFGPAIAVACIAIGVFGYRPEKMQAIRAAEAQEAQPVVVEEVRAIHVPVIEKFSHYRLDRHPTYIGLHVAAWCYAWCIFAGAPITSNLTELNIQTRLSMAACFLVGSSLALSGAMMGMKVGPWYFLRGISDNIASARLSDDIRLPYTFACVAMVMMAISFSIYASTSFRSTAGSLGGWITLCMAGTSAILLGVFYRRIRIYVLVRSRVINEAVANIIKRGGPSVDH